MFRTMGRCAPFVPRNTKGSPAACTNALNNLTFNYRFAVELLLWTRRASMSDHGCRVKFVVFKISRIFSVNSLGQKKGTGRMKKRATCTCHCTHLTPFEIVAQAHVTKRVGG